jgi:4-hydroxy-tetrahydrodipicolinate synthase
MDALKQEIRNNLTGPVASIRTPFLRDGRIDYAGLRRYVDFSIQAGSPTMLLTWGDSLYTLLTDDDIAEVTRVVCEQTAGRAMVVAAERNWGTPKLVEFARYAKQTGAGVLMVMPPDWAGSCTTGTLVDHYAAAAAELPVMIITATFVPRGEAFGLETLKRVRDEVPGVVAIKDDWCGEFGRKMSLLVHDHWAVFAGGQKQNHLNLHPFGCDGYLSTFITFKPQVSHDYWKAIQAEDMAKAVEIIRNFDLPLFEFIMARQGSFDAWFHGMYEHYGLCGRWRRPPYYSLSDAEMEQLGDFLKKQGLL